MTDKTYWQVSPYFPNPENPVRSGADSSADAETNRVAFQAALDNIAAIGGGELIIPPRIFNINGPLTFDHPGLALKITGANPAATLAFTGGGDNGLVVNADLIELSGFRVVVSAMPNIGQGSAVYLRNSSGLGGSFQNIVVEKMRFEGRVDARPGNFLAVNSPAHSRIRDVSICGFYNESFPHDSVGVYCFGEVAPNGGACGDWSISDVTVLGVGTAFKVVSGDAQGRPTIEGTSFTDCVAVGVQIGLDMQGLGYLAPGHSWKGGHINAQQVCARFKSYSQFTISDALLYLDAGGAAKQGFVLFDGCAQMSAHNNRMVHLAQTGDTQQGVFGIAFANGTTGSRADDNDGLGFPGGSAVIFNQSGGNNRAGGNGRSGQGLNLAGSGLIDLGGNHVF